MTKEEIAQAVLRRLYEGMFGPGGDSRLNLHQYSQEIKADETQVWNVYEDLKAKGWVRICALGGWVTMTSCGILHCEEDELVDPDLISHQLSVRTKLLVAAAKLREERGANAFGDWTTLCSQGDVDPVSFVNNYHFLRDFGMLESVTARGVKITPQGYENVLEHRACVERLELFRTLEALDGVTVQARGHKLEDLLQEVAKSAGWSAESRIRSQGQEHDLIIHVGLHYFLVSCKWEKDPIEPHEVELLESRVRSRATTNGGLLFSMSGFTDNCIEETRMKIPMAQILLFGPEDIENIFSSASSLTDLLDAKLEQAMHHRRILVDGMSR